MHICRCVDVRMCINLTKSIYIYVYTWLQIIASNCKIRRPWPEGGERVRRPSEKQGEEKEAKQAHEARRGTWRTGTWSESRNKKQEHQATRARSLYKNSRGKGKKQKKCQARTGLFQRGQGHGFLVPQHCFLAPKLQTLTTIQNCLDGSLYTVTSKLLTLSWSSRKNVFFSDSDKTCLDGSLYPANSELVPARSHTPSPSGMVCEALRIIVISRAQT